MRYSTDEDKVTEQFTPDYTVTVEFFAFRKGRGEKNQSFSSDFYIAFLKL